MEAKITVPQAYCISVTWHCAVNMHCFDTSAFSTSCFILSVMDGKIKQHVCVKFCEKLHKSTTETLKMNNVAL
jgi:hypothetical protein